MIKYTTALLIVAAFLERYCFVVVVYQTKYYGYVLILLVVAMNCAFNSVIWQIQPKKKSTGDYQMHEIFNLDRSPKVGNCVIATIGAIDMARAVLLFWPANVLPLYLLITLLQIYIPLNYLMRQLVVGVKQHKKHTFAALTILLAVGVNSSTLQSNWD